MLRQVCDEKGAVLCKPRQSLVVRHAGHEHHQPVAGTGEPSNLLDDRGNPEGIIALLCGFPGIDDVGDPTGPDLLVHGQDHQEGFGIAPQRPDIAAAKPDWAVANKIDDFKICRVGR